MTCIIYYARFNSIESIYIMLKSNKAEFISLNKYISKLPGLTTKEKILEYKVVFAAIGLVLLIGLISYGISNYSPIREESSAASTWNVVGDTSVISSTNSNYPDLKFNPTTNEPWVAFENGFSGGIVVMNYTGGNWVQVGGSVGSSDSRRPVLEFQPGTNDAYLAVSMDYNYGSRGSLFKYDGSSWQSVGTRGFTSDATYGVGGWTICDRCGTAVNMDIAFHPNTNDPYVSYSESSVFGTIWTMRYSGGNWEIACNDDGAPDGWTPTLGNPVLDNCNYLSGNNVNIEFDPISENLHAAYIHDQSGGVQNMPRLARMQHYSQDSRWIILTGAGNSGGLPSFKFHPTSNIPYIGYSDVLWNCGDFGANVFSYQEGGAGYQQIGNTCFNTVGDAGTPDLAFEPGTNTPYVGFTENGATVMKLNAGTWEYVGSPSFSSGDAGATSFAFNPSTGEPFIAFVDNSDGNRIEVMSYSEFNISPLASSITCSSELNSSLSCTNVNSQSHGTCNVSEWAANEQEGAWVQLDWVAATDIDKVILFDRACPGRVLTGTLTFSDGSTPISFSDLEDLGIIGTQVSFATKNVSWVRVTLDSSTHPWNSYPGLSEVEVYGVPLIAPTSTNTPTPLPTNTPTPGPSSTPTNTPTPSNTPRPTNTPTPGPSPTPTNTPTPVTPTPTPGTGGSVSEAKVFQVEGLDSTLNALDRNFNVVEIGTTRGLIGINDVYIQDVENDLVIARLNGVNFEEDLNWTNLTGAGESDVIQKKTVLHIEGDIEGFSGSFNLYIPKGSSDNVVRYCPNAISLDEVQIACASGLTLKNGQTLDGITARVVSFRGEETWLLSGVTGSGGVSFLNQDSPTLVLPTKVATLPDTGNEENSFLAFVSGLVDSVQNAIVNLELPEETLPVVSVVPAAGVGIINVISYPRFLVYGFAWISGKKKKKSWGVVFDEDKDQPIPFASVKLFSGEQFIDEQITNLEGKYGFAVDEGAYTLVVDHPEYSTYKQEIEIKNAGAFAQDIGMSFEKDEDQSWVRFKTLMKDNIRKVSTFLALVGFTISIVAVILSPMLLNFLLVGFYVVQFFIIGISILLERRQWGYVYDSSSKNRVSGAFVRIFDTEQNRQLDVKLTSHSGRYGFILNPGSYRVKVDHVNYIFPSNLQKKSDLFVAPNGDTFLNVNVENNKQLNLAIALDPKDGVISSARSNIQISGMASPF